MWADLAGVSYAEALAALKVQLSPPSVEHCQRVADTAAQLAVIYGVDEATARLAGLLHDWDRDLKGAALVGRARVLGVPVGVADESVPYLLHARTGAADVAVAFPGIDPEIVTAIARHTVGAVGMSDLDKVIYVADMIEPARTFKGVEVLRESVGHVSLDELFLGAYDRSIRHLIKARKLVHPDTVEVWNSLVAQVRG